MFKILFEEFLGDLKAQKLRAALTFVAVTWGTAAVVLLLAFGEGIKRRAMEGNSSAGDRMFMIYGGETSMPYEGMPKGREIRLVEGDLELLQRSLSEADLFSASYG